MEKPITKVEALTGLLISFVVLVIVLIVSLNCKL